MTERVTVYAAQSPEHVDIILSNKRQKMCVLLKQNLFKDVKLVHARTADFIKNPFLNKCSIVVLVCPTKLPTTVLNAVL